MNPGASGRTLQVEYNPGVFAVASIEQAMEIILTPEDSSTEQRWRTETPYLAGLIAESIELTTDSLVLDYGCGIGRMAKALISAFGCRVVGVDISLSMRALAHIYVDSDRFFSCSPEMIDYMGAREWRFDAAISIWVLQHCLAPQVDIARIKHSLKPEAALFIANGEQRAVPTLAHGWIDDGIDVKGLLCNAFDLRKDGRLARESTSPLVASGTFWASFGNHGATAPKCSSEGRF